jgi:hypothetical protein
VLLLLLEGQHDQLLHEPYRKPRQYCISTAAGLLLLLLEPAEGCQQHLYFLQLQQQRPLALQYLQLL